MTVLGLSKKDVSCFSILRPSTFAIVPAVALLAAALTRTRVILACLVLLSSLLWFELRLPLYLQHRLKHTPHCIPDRLALIGRAWKTFRPGPGSGKALIVWMAGICFGQLKLFESILAWMR